TDNVLLRSLSTHHSPATSPEEDKRWKAGLGELIKELKMTNLGKQDVGAIAERIAQYRRDFVADPTKTLHLV
ncbi:uncharacterized protein K489DRAFT_321163, partial [Dissoconium aciculare CBS 342.82]|uniref:Uncharacterized protein n=1 Tax=Dissoconium aciculare CBS 342.82 TaxID=1314786 RepID=A0A6J3M693_9PEZI